MVEDKQIDLLKSLIENRQEIYERLAPRVNIVDILGNTYYEVQNSKLLYYIFNTHFKYYDKEINFVKDFSLYIVGNEYKDKIKNAKFENVYREFQTKEGRRIDILIVFDKFEIIIENKINAGEQESQLEDYYKDRYNNGKEIFLVYLTRWKYEASEYSISKETKEELKDKIYYLSHGDMAKWIENDILNKYEFLKFDKKYQSIYSALIQIRDNEKTITNPNEENNMEKEEIKKFFEREDNNYFETLLNKDETIKDSFDKLNKFYELLENAQRVIIDKKFELISGNIKYSSKVSEFIKKVQFDKGEDYMKGAILYNEEGIKGQFNGIWSRNILISIIGYLDLCITLEQNIYIVDYHLFINIIANNNIANKLREEPIKTEIGKILGKDSNKYKEDEDRGYIYTLYIDIEKDKPEEIGQKIIDLYNLLKEKITQ
ncbi:PD-(D/E)XK nuclease family protein [uncultured Brachyspira sp.]|uniref:PD-(D/E)XK nuclease family protein n=1 Tax=uncultured Brachyspira sp. TaxID=221953 RepID=UPI00259B5D64|nr:PD-(D/E)XK nuclease family protein [uncultured Brachyspira sp.]